MTMGPGVNCNVQIKLFERPGEQRGVILDIVANHELGRMRLGLCQEIIQLGGSLELGSFQNKSGA
jgi:hypothetical protein